MPWEGLKVNTEEPADYDPAKPFADPVTYYKHREAKVAQEYVKVAEAKVRRPLCSQLTCAQTPRVLGKISASIWRQPTAA